VKHVRQLLARLHNVRRQRTQQPLELVLVGQDPCEIDPPPYVCRGVNALNSRCTQLW
jgi:hypothetical protein